MCMNIYDNAIIVNSKNWKSEALSELKDKGVIVLRGIENNNNLNSINKKISNVLKSPSILGSIGYYQKDPFKKLYDGFLLGNEVIKMVANKDLINIIETYVNDEIILNEIFVKYDLGTELIYFPYHRHTGTDIEGPVDKPFGCGSMIYLHDTEDGAFCYSLYSHNLPISKGAESVMAKHENKIQLEANLHKVVGKKGDVIIFDERGFHGPEQPSSNSRKVLLFGYQSKKSTLNRSRTAIPVLISDLKGLNQKQLSSIGIGGGTRGDYLNYHVRKGAAESKAYKQSSSLIKKIYSKEIKAFKLKKAIKSFFSNF